MKHTSKELKTMARQMLTGQYGTYLMAYVIYFIINNTISSVVSFATGVSSLINPETGELISATNLSALVIYLIATFIVSLILSVLDMGFNRMFLNGSRGQQIMVKDMLYGFKHQPDRAILYQLMATGLPVLCLAPGYGVTLLGSYMDSSIALLLIGTLLLLIGLWPYFYFTICFSQGMFLIADYETIGPVQALKESMRLMKHNKMRYFTLSLSFVGLYILCLLSCTMGYLFLFPYINMTMTLFYRDITGELNQPEIYAD